MIQFKQGETVWIGRSEFHYDTFDGNLHKLSIIDTGQIMNKGVYLVDELAQQILRHAPYDVPDEKPKAKFADAKKGQLVYHILHGLLSIEYVGIRCITVGGYVFDLMGYYMSASNPSIFLSEQDCIDYWKSQEGK
jgi:hypothetical protein